MTILLLLDSADAVVLDPFANLSFEQGTFGDPGSPDSWIADIVSAAIAVAGYPGPIEKFEKGWGINEIIDELNDANTDAALFLDLLIESYEKGWQNNNALFEAAFSLFATYGGIAFVTSTLSGPYALSDGDTLSVTTEQGGPAVSDAITATAAEVTGSGGTFPTGFGRDADIRIDLNGAIQVISLDFIQSRADVVAAINDALGATIATESFGEIKLTSTVEGSSSSIGLIEASVARVTTTDAAPFAFSPGDVLDVSIDGGPVQNVVFNSADFPDIGNVSAFQVAQHLEANLTGNVSARARYGVVELFSTTTTGTIDVQGGTANSVLSFTVGLTQAPLPTLGLTPGTYDGTGNVADLSAVTAQEIADICNTSLSFIGIGAGVVAVNPDDADGIRVVSRTPTTGTIKVNSSPIATSLGFALTTQGPTGILPLSKEDFEVEWGNTDYNDPTYSDGPDETFEAGWDNDTYNSPTYDDALFGTTGADVTTESFEFVEEPEEFTVNTATDRIVSTSHGLSNGDIITFDSSGNLPDPLSRDTTYYVLNTTTNNFQVELAPGAGAVQINDNGTNTHTYRRDTTKYWTQTIDI